MLQELLSSKKPYGAEEKAIASLQNVKQGLKRCYSDTEIVQFVLGMDFLERIMKEHTGLLMNASKRRPRIHDKLTFVDRDPGIAFAASLIML